MAWWVAALKWAGLFVASSLLSHLTRKKDGGIQSERPGFPDADPTRPIPVVFGTCLMPLNIVRHDGYTVHQVKKGDGGLFGTGLLENKVHIANEYAIDAMAVVAHGECALLDLVVAGKHWLMTAGKTIKITFQEGSWIPQKTNRDVVTVVGLKDDVSTWTYDVWAPGVLGGEGFGGGVRGQFTWYRGNTWQTPDAYTEGKAGKTLPHYREIAYLVMRGLILGESPHLPAVQVLVARAARGPGVASLDNRFYTLNLGGDANGASIIWELLTHPRHGLNLPESWLEAQSFYDAAVATASLTGGEGLGLSFAITGDEATEQVIADVLQTIDAALYQHPTTGRLNLKLIRPLSPLALSLTPLVSPANARECVWTDPLPASAANEVRLTYVDRDKRFRENSVTATNTALVQAMGRVETKEIRLLGVSTETWARRLAARELRVETTPLGRARIVMDRTGYLLCPGDVFRLTWPEHDLVEVPMRVLSVDWGSLDEPEIVVEAVQDVFALPPVPTAITVDPIPDPIGAGTTSEIPSVTPIGSQTATTGTVALQIADPSDVVTGLEWRTQVGHAAPSAWTAGDLLNPVHTVTLGAGVVSAIAWRVSYTTSAGVTDVIEGVLHFQPAEPTTAGPATEPVVIEDGAGGFEIVYDDDGNIIYA